MSPAFWMLTVLIVSEGAGQPSPPTSAPSSQPSEFARQLDAIDRRASSITDLTADFVQEKRSPLLRKPLISRGTVKAKGGLALWETSEPEPTKMSVDPKLLRMYYPKQDIIEEYPMQQQLGMMAASPLPRLRDIQTIFTMQPDSGDGLLAANAMPANACAVRMEPIDPELRKSVDHVRVMLDADRGLMLAFEMVDPDGEQTILRFSNVQTNANLTEESLKLKTPAGVKVVRPLEGVR